MGLRARDSGEMAIQALAGLGGCGLKDSIYGQGLEQDLPPKTGIIPSHKCAFVSQLPDEGKVCLEDRRVNSSS